MGEGDKMAAGGAWPVPPWSGAAEGGSNPKAVLPKNKIDWERISDLISLLEKNLK